MNQAVTNESHVTNNKSHVPNMFVTWLSSWSHRSLSVCALIRDSFIRESLGESTDTARDVTPIRDSLICDVTLIHDSFIRDSLVRESLRDTAWDVTLIPYSFIGDVTLIHDSSMLSGCICTRWGVMIHSCVCSHSWLSHSWLLPDSRMKKSLIRACEVQRFTSVWGAKIHECVRCKDTLWWVPFSFVNLRDTLSWVTCSFVNLSRVWEVQKFTNVWDAKIHFRECLFYSWILELHTLSWVTFPFVNHWTSHALIGDFFIRESCKSHEWESHEWEHTHEWILEPRTRMIDSCVCALIRVSALIRDSLVHDSELFTQAVSAEAQCRDSFVWVLSFVARLSIQILPADAEMPWFIHVCDVTLLFVTLSHSWLTVSFRFYPQTPRCLYGTLFHSRFRDSLIRDSLLHSRLIHTRRGAFVGPHFTYVFEALPFVTFSFVTLTFVTLLFIQVLSADAEVPLWDPISLVYSWLSHSWLSHLWLSHSWLLYSFRSYLQTPRCLCGTPFQLFVCGSPIRDFLIRDSHICDSLIYSGLICRHRGASVGPPFSAGVYVYLLKYIIYMYIYIIYIYNIL